MAEIVMNIRVIKWLKPIGQRDLTNPIQGTDYDDIRSTTRIYEVGSSPFIDDDLNKDYEIFVEVEDSPEVLNEEIQFQNIVSRPTMENHPDFPEYKIFRISPMSIKREVDSMIFTIKSKESECNNRLLSDGKFELANILATQLGITLAKNMPPSPEMLLGEQRFSEIFLRMGLNNATAIEKIRLAKLGQPFNIEQGWEIDSLTPLGSPFNDIEG